MQKKKEQLAEDVYLGYSKFIKFTAGDLEANRAGFISHSQKQRARIHYLIFFVTALPFLACVAPLGIAMMLRFPIVRDSAYLSIVMLILVALIAIVFTFAPLLIGYAFLRLSFDLWSDLRNGGVKAISLAEYASHKKAHGPMRFAMEDDRFLPYRPNTRIYILPRSLQILSVEMILPE